MGAQFSMHLKYMPIKGTSDECAVIMLRAHLTVRLCQGMVNKEYHWNHDYLLSIYTHNALCYVFVGRRDNEAGREISGSTHWAT